jgi:hypothetical protein
MLKDYVFRLQLDTFSNCCILDDFDFIFLKSILAENTSKPLWIFCILVFGTYDSSLQFSHNNSHAKVSQVKMRYAVYLAGQLLKFQNRKGIQ